MHEKNFSGIIRLMFSHNENELIAIGQKIGRLLQARDVLILSNGFYKKRCNHTIIMCKANT